MSIPAGNAFPDAVYWADLDVGCLVGMAVLPVLMTATLSWAFIGSGLVTAVANAALLVLAARGQDPRRTAASLGGASDVVHPLQHEAVALQQQVPGAGCGRRSRTGSPVAAALPRKVIRPLVGIYHPSTV